MQPVLWKQFGGWVVGLVFQLDSLGFVHTAAENRPCQPYLQIWKSDARHQGVLLEMGGVNVTTWGMCLGSVGVVSRCEICRRRAKGLRMQSARYTEDSLKCLLDELKIGASTLERDDVSGKAGLPCRCFGTSVPNEAISFVCGA